MADAKYLASYLGELFAARPTTHWIHVITYDYYRSLRIEYTVRSTSLTAEEAIASRIQWLPNAPDVRDWSRNGMTLHILQATRETWATYQAADTHTKQTRTESPLNI